MFEKFVTSTQQQIAEEFYQQNLNVVFLDFYLHPSQYRFTIDGIITNLPNNDNYDDYDVHVTKNIDEEKQSSTKTKTSCSIV